MSERKPSLLVQDIVNCIDHIQIYTGNLSFEDFSSNFMAIEACLYNIQVIGEAVTHLPQNVKDKKPTGSMGADQGNEKPFNTRILRY